MTEFFGSFLYQYQREFWRGYNSHYLAFRLDRKRKTNVDNDKPFVALLTERFSKTFDCLSQELLITKLNTYGFIKIY